MSVALATYNGAAHVEQQLDSIVGQSCQPVEIVVSDDGSSDDTIAIIENYARSSPVPIRVLPSGDRLGFADNFFRAAVHCTSPYIAFCDQDDVWLKDKIEIGYQRLIEDNSRLSMHRSLLTNGELVPYDTLHQGISRDAIIEPLELDPYTVGWGNTMMFDRTLLDLFPVTARPMHPEHAQRPLSHDTWIYTLAVATGRVSHISEPLCLYRQHDGNVFGTRNPSLSERLIAMITVPVDRYRARMEFDAAIAELFTGHPTEGPALRGVLDRAGAAYSKRRDQLGLRLTVYLGKTMKDRLSAFIRLVRANDAPGRAAVLSLLKDGALGVLRLGKIQTQDG